MPWVKEVPKEDNFFNYMVAFQDGKRLKPYNYFSQIHFGNQEQADWYLNYVKSVSPGPKWEIYKLEKLMDP